MMSLTCIGDDLTSFLLPTYCIGCGTRTEGPVPLCPACFETLPLYEGMESYYHPFGRIEGLVPLTEVESDLIFYEGGLVQQLIHLAKYRSLPRIGYHLARRFASVHLSRGHFGDVTRIVPIPIAPARRLRRGYNQTLFIAQAISETYSLPVDTTSLRRSRGNSGTQTTKGRQSRWESLEGVFACVPGSVAGRRILLVDDVLTSGATIVHAARALYDQGGAESVSVYTLALDMQL